MSLFDVLYSTSTEFDVSLRQLAVLVFPQKSPMCRIYIPQKSPIQNGGCYIYINVLFIDTSVADTARRGNSAVRAPQHRWQHIGAIL